jgi:hypothetical protein
MDGRPGNFFPPITNVCKSGEKGQVLNLNEDDTAKALRRIPYAELKNLITAGSHFDSMTTEEKAEYLELHGWTQDELIQALFDELGAIMKEFP